MRMQKLRENTMLLQAAVRTYLAALRVTFSTHSEDSPSKTSRNALCLLRNTALMHFEYLKPAHVGAHNEPLTRGWCICCHGTSQLAAEASGFALLEAGKGSYGMASQHHTSPWGM